MRVACQMVQPQDVAESCERAYVRGVIVLRNHRDVAVRVPPSKARMHQLHLLGRAGLTDPDGKELRAVLSQPKRLGLLAYLAIEATDGSCRRDRLLLLFWPELTQDRARNALNKAVHFLRQSLREDIIVSRGAEELGIDGSRLGCDAVDFTRAIARGGMADALELYRGELLPAFHIEDGAEFESWLEGKRTELRRAASQAAHALAQQREQEGQFTVAIGLARRAVETADDDERSVRQLLELLDRLGDRAGALYAYDKFARRLQAEFRSEPAAETKALIGRVRNRVDARSLPVIDEAEGSPRPNAQPLNDVAHSWRVPRPAFFRTWKVAAIGAFAAAVGGAAMWAFETTPDFSVDRVVVMPLVNNTGNAQLDGTISQLLATLPDAIAREGVAEIVPATVVGDLVRKAPRDAARRADWLATKTGAGLQVRGVCSSVPAATVCQVDVMRMPARVLRLSIAVSGDPAREVFAAELRERLLVALFLQRVWGDHVRWQGEYIPRSLAAARAFKQACCDGTVQRRYFSEAARLDTSWAAAIAWALRDSSEVVAESTFARLMRRPDLLEGERETVRFAFVDDRLTRRSKPMEPGVIDANTLAQLSRRRFAVNPEWWLVEALYWSFFTGRPSAVLEMSRYSDSARTPRDGLIRGYALRGAALHWLGRNRELLELADEIERRFEGSEARTARVMALAALGEVDSLRRLLKVWEATPEPQRGRAGSRSYVGGLELMAHGREREGREVLAGTIPLYRRIRASEGLRWQLWEVLFLTGRFDEARQVLVADLPGAKFLADSLYAYGILGAIALRQQAPAEAARHFAAAQQLYDRVARMPSRPIGMMSYVKALMGDKEGAVRLLEEARMHGLGFAEYRLAHRAPALLSLYGYPPFEHFLKARD